MDFDDVVRRRRMVRDFDPRRLDPAVLRRALSLALRAPSAGHTQGRDFVLLTEPDDRAAYWEAAIEPGEAGAPDEAGEGVEPGAPRQARARWLRGVRRAPALVVVCSDPEAYVGRYGRPDKAATGYGAGAAAWPIPYWDVDAGMSALLLLLSAVDDGIGGLFFGVPPARHDAVREALGVPTDRRLVGVVALGHPAAPAPDPSAAMPPSGRTTPRRRHRPVRRRLQDSVHLGRYGSAPSPGWGRSGDVGGDLRDEPRSEAHG